MKKAFLFCFLLIASSQSDTFDVNNSEKKADLNTVRRSLVYEAGGRRDNFYKNSWRRPPEDYDSVDESRVLNNFTDTSRVLSWNKPDDKVKIGNNCESKSEGTADHQKKRILEGSNGDSNNGKTNKKPQRKRMYLKIPLPFSDRPHGTKNHSPTSFDAFHFLTHLGDLTKFLVLRYMPKPFNYYYPFTRKRPTRPQRPPPVPQYPAAPVGLEEGEPPRPLQHKPKPLSGYMPPSTNKYPYPLHPLPWPQSNYQYDTAHVGVTAPHHNHKPSLQPLYGNPPPLPNTNSHPVIENNDQQDVTSAEVAGEPLSISTLPSSEPALQNSDQQIAGTTKLVTKGFQSSLLSRSTSTSPKLQTHDRYDTTPAEVTTKGSTALPLQILSSPPPRPSSNKPGLPPLLLLPLSKYPTVQPPTKASMQTEKIETTVTEKPTSSSTSYLPQTTVFKCLSLVRNQLRTKHKDLSPCSEETSTSETVSVVTVDTKEETTTESAVKVKAKMKKKRKRRKKNTKSPAL